MPHGTSIFLTLKGLSCDVVGRIRKPQHGIIMPQMHISQDVCLPYFWYMTCHMKSAHGSERYDGA